MAKKAKPRPIIQSVKQSTPNSVEIVLEDGREVKVILEGEHNPNKILVVYDPLQWSFDECEFVDFGQPYED